MNMPRFTVAVPCHGANYKWLVEALDSVRRQLDPRDHQLVVVDDMLDPWTKKAAGEFGFSYQAVQDHGGVAAHNACYGMATGELVHVLHPDDWILDGFYGTIARMAESSPGVGLYATAALNCRDDGRPYCVALCDWVKPFPPLHFGNPLCVAATVVRRDTVVRHGAWNPKLVHTADWEMWARLSHAAGAVYCTVSLACYRVSAINDTSKLMRTAENLRDYLRFVDVARDYATVDDRLFRAYVRHRALNQASEFDRLGDKGAAVANRQLAEELR